ncbi:MAG: DUF1553 domain-containing protein [Verrucomicrobiota bacterium]
MKSLPAIIGLSALVLLRATGADVAVDISKLPPPFAGAVEFSQDIQPIFEKSCYPCHGPEKQKGDYRLDRKEVALKGGENGPNILPGKSAQSPLIHFVSGLVEDKKMPAKGEPLTSNQIGLLRAWIDQGASWPAEADTTPKHWAFTKPERSDLPTIQNNRWARNAIDHFILARLEEKKLAPSQDADRVALLRRLKFDLLGLPPSPEEIQECITDKSSAAYEKWVERFLASPHYGERWARHWMDVVRFAESSGFETNVPRDNAWPYRDWVIQSLNEDKPYDRFVMEQLAGDQLGADAATGFIVAGPYDQVKSPDVVLTAQQRADELHDMVATTGSAFLGLTVGCARCHNHKFDPISQTDYYGMTAVFAGVQHGERDLKSPDAEKKMADAATLREKLPPLLKQLSQFEPLAKILESGTKFDDQSLRPPVNARQNTDRFSPVRARYVRFTIFKTTSAEPCIDELELHTTDEGAPNVALATLGARATASGTYPNSTIHRLEHINDGQFGNERSWISNEQGAGWVQIELAGDFTVDRLIWGRDRNGKYQDRLATHYKIEVAVNTNEWKLVASSEDRQPFSSETKPIEFSARLSPADQARYESLAAEKQKLESEIARLTAVPRIYAGQFAQPGPTYRLQRGDPMEKREPVAPGVLKEFGPALDLPSETPEAQRRLELARWIVNPENPMTARVMVNRIWQHHFGNGLVKTPSDFGVNGARPSHPELLDWLASEFVRTGWSIKQIHRLIVLSSTYRQSSQPNSTAQKIDAADALLWRFPPQRLEAEPLRDAILAISGNLDPAMGGRGFDLFEPNNNYVKVYLAKKEFTPAESRRMIYQAKPRMQLDDTFGAFDCPDGGQIAPRRNSSTTPLQALNLLNSTFILQQAEIFAKRLEREAGNDAASQTRTAFELVFARKPDRTELAVSEKLIREHGLQTFCRALFNANEFINVF